MRRAVRRAGTASCELRAEPAPYLLLREAGSAHNVACCGSPSPPDAERRRGAATWHVRAHTRSTAIYLLCLSLCAFGFARCIVMRTGWMAVRERVFLVAGVARGAGPGGRSASGAALLSCALCRCERRSNGERKLCWHTIDKNKAATLGNTSLHSATGPRRVAWTQDCGVWCVVCGVWCVGGRRPSRSTPQPQPPPMPAPADACAVALCHRRHTQTLAANVARLVTMRLARPLLHQNRPVCRRRHAMGNGQR